MLIEDYQTREDWLAARSGFIGASESAAILGCGYSGRNALTVYASKVKPEEMNDAATDAMVVGALIEPGLLRVFEHFAELGAELEIPNRVRKLERLPFIGATLDAYTITDNLPVELKNVDGHLMKQWNDENQAPLKYQIQCAHQMLVTGAPKSYLMGLIGGNKPVIRELYRNDRFIEVLENKLVEFWGFVKRKDLPTDFIEWGSDATSDALKTLHPDDNGETVYLGDECQEVYREWITAKDATRTAEKRLISAENRLVAAIGDNTFGILPGGEKLSFKTQRRAGFVAKESKFRVLRVSKKTKG